MLLRPSLHIEAVGVATGERLGHFCGQQEGASALLRDLQQHQPHPAHEFRDLPAPIPLMTDRQAGNVAGEIDLNAVKVVAGDEFTQERDLVLARDSSHLLDQCARHTAAAQDHLYEVAWASQGYMVDIEHAATATRLGGVVKAQHQATGEVVQLKSRPARWGRTKRLAAAVPVTGGSDRAVSTPSST